MNKQAMVSSLTDLFKDQTAFDAFLKVRRLAASARVVRAFYNLSQAELALEIGVSRKTVVMIENGLTIPADETVDKFYRYLASREISVKTGDAVMQFTFSNPVSRWNSIPPDSFAER